MASIQQITNLESIDIIIHLIQTFFVSLMTYYTSLKINNNKEFSGKKLIIVVIALIVIDFIYAYFRYGTDALTSIIFLLIMLSLLYSIINKQNMGYSILSIMIALSINYILLIVSIVLMFIPNILKPGLNDYFNVFCMMFIHFLLLYKVMKIKKFKNGFSFLNRNSKNEFLDLLSLNISVGILLSVIIFTNIDIVIRMKIFFIFFVFVIFMFITIQKSLQLYYKQKLLIQDLEETKKELADKNKEIEQLEKENLNFSKTSHSIAHKQKALEYKLNELLLKNEMANETDLKSRIENINKDLNQTKIVELDKTEISEIDDMLKYMQSECVKNGIDFQLQLTGNIHHIINNYITKEKLEILLADHIKNSIIAIKHSNNTNKSILVRLGKIDNTYGLYIYDSGIEFKESTLETLGSKPITTHKDEGGTGMGFMNTFDTLKESKASMEIHEYGKPSKDDFTKVIMIKFDNKNEFKISSYRSQVVKN